MNLTPGKTVPLKTVFDSKTRYTIVVSGLITYTTTSTGSTWTIDPFHSITGGICKDENLLLSFELKDAGGYGIGVADAGRPACRADHRYTFVVNGKPYRQLEGRATASVGGPSPGSTVSGSFTLQIVPTA